MYYLNPPPQVIRGSLNFPLSVFPSMLEDDLQLSDSEDSDTEQVSVELRDQEPF